MKRLVASVVALGLMASIVIAQSAKSVNAVGYNSMEIPAGKLVMVSFPWIPMAGTNLSDLVGAQLPLNSGIWKWTGLGYSFSSYSSGRAGAAWSPNFAIDRGDCFWVRNAGTAPATLTLTGEVPTDKNYAASTTVTIANVDMVAFSYPVDVKFVETDLYNKSQLNDAIWVWNGNGYDFYQKTSGRSGVAWPTSVTGLTFSAGSSFWYKRGDGGLVDWDQIVPYNIDQD